MKKSIFILLFVGFSFLVKGQNLVPNPSFEYFTSCPTTSGGELQLATPWVALPINNVEYFNGCAPAYNYSVPFQSGLSFQNAKTGNGMAGFWMLNGKKFKDIFFCFIVVGVFSEKFINTIFYYIFRILYSTIKLILFGYWFGRYGYSIFKYLYNIFFLDEGFAILRDFFIKK